ncbi:hypothetical protein CKN86_13325 [Carnobacterium divergens]|uniref:class I SAM-dependent methyltransferase n=1 Tax=Carnobacterium divergens TaxID=2748 RepID=UPI000D4030A8|nr:class I SAM-dependent methyltransferase [Carnobacterium divergens]MCO6019385.1 class I SAM-dependent methyltransferase [Carnobacterium divergens]MPQ23463.1 class I SAM-dependent methyltransferase [Carnobacterium divergens]TFI62078.1 hypothetical protein CKN62_07690 [Carnobacterium divergens]TFI86762.1 hypothetical protein CKN84_13730 [Carnobacterium divergens]TFJ01840.1 hypothetical protein CKN86_13325 [Carnobacterium divergens]
MKRWEILEKILKNKGNLHIAEIGVYEGKVSKYLLNNLSIEKYWVIDPYENYDQYNDTKANIQLLDNAYKKLKKEVLVYNNTLFLKKFSKDAAKDVPNNSLDLVFIDGNHEYEFVLEDIKIWKEKVKKGGIISGHDYDYPNIEGVKIAVDEFFENEVTIENDYVWYVIKK